MSEINNELNTEPEQNWSIVDDQGAEWALKKIAEAKQERDSWINFYTEKINKEIDKAQSTIDFMTYQLRKYFEREDVKKHSTKTASSYELPSGKLVLKNQQPEYVRDDAKLSNWAKESGHSDYVKTITKESFDWASMKKDLGNYMVTDEGFVVDPATGEVIEGIEIVHREPKFVIE